MNRTFDDEVLFRYKEKFQLSSDESLLLICILISEKNNRDFDWCDQQIGEMVFGYSKNDRFLIEKTTLIIEKMVNREIIRIDYKNQNNKMGKVKKKRIIVRDKVDPKKEKIF